MHILHTILAILQFHFLLLLFRLRSSDVSALRGGLTRGQSSLLLLWTLYYERSTDLWDGGRLAGLLDCRLRLMP